MKKIALVTGANRGIGLEISKQLAQQGLKVLMAMRTPAAALVEGLKAGGADVEHLELDISSAPSIEAGCKEALKRHGRVDVLVNNAGIFGNEKGAFEADVDTVLKVFQTNTVGALLMMQKLVPAMQKNNYGRVVNISSGMGQLSEMEGGYVAYRLSKVSLNALTRIFSDETDTKNVLINSCCPGWVKTDMGGPSAEREVSKGAETPVWLATLPENGPKNGFFRDKEPLDW